MSEGVSVTADTPTPFRIIDVVAVIEDWLGMLDQRSPVPISGRCATGSRGSTAIRGFGSCLAGWWSGRYRQGDLAPLSIPTRGCRSPSSSLRACPTRSSTRSSRCSRGCVRNAFWCRGGVKWTGCAKRRTAIFQPTAGKPWAGQAGDRPDAKEGRNTAPRSGSCRNVPRSSNSTVFRDAQPCSP